MFTVFRSDSEMGRVPDVWMVPVPAGEPTLLMRSASAASMSPDGRSLVYSSVTAGGTSIRVRHPDGRDVEVASRGFWPRWSPRGDWIAFTTSDPEGGNGTLHVVRPDGTDRRELTTESSQFYGLCWTPDGSRLIYANDSAGTTMLWSVDVDGGAERPVTRGPGICTSPTMAADGRRLVFDFSHRRWFIYLVPRLGEEPKRVLMEPGMHAAALSSDGSRVAVALGAEAQSPAISIIDLPSGERRTISALAASGVAWMPDGESLLVTAPAPDDVNRWIWRVPVNGGLPEPVIAGDQSWSAPSPSPDGRKIAALRTSKKGFELVVRDLGTGRDRVITEGQAIVSPKWSPDGSQLVWSGKWRPDDVGSGGVWVCEAEGGTQRRLALEGAWPVWDPAGDAILYLRFIEHRGVWRVSLAGDEPRLVQRLDGDVSDYLMEGLDVARDNGSLLLFLYQYTGELYALEPAVD
jgi:Tol biopolymer transport system component